MLPINLDSDKYCMPWMLYIFYVRTEMETAWKPHVYVPYVDKLKMKMDG